MPDCVYEMTEKEDPYLSDCDCEKGTCVCAQSDINKHNAIVNDSFTCHDVVRVQMSACAINGIIDDEIKENEIQVEADEKNDFQPLPY